MPRILAITALLGGVAAAMPAAAQEPPRPEDGAFISTVTFTCERGVSVPVAYVNTAGDPGFAVMQFEGRQIAMYQVISASGTRYRSIDAATPYELFGKGNDGTIGYGPEDDVTILLADCVAE